MIHKNASQLTADSLCKQRSSYRGIYTAGKSELSLTEATVNNALTAFTDATGIPVVVVVDTLDSVFSRTLTTESILVLILAVVLIVIAIVLIVRYFRRRDRGAEE